MSLNFSVVLSVYLSDNAEFFDFAIKSLLNQTKKPSEIIIVTDGPVGQEIKNILDIYKKNSLFQIIELSENVGLSQSRKKAISHCSNNVIAVMDSDDISVSDRFEKQISLIESGKFEVVGGWIREFQNTPNDGKKIRKTPTKYSEIKSFGKWRNPINHVTLMFTKEAYEFSGGYSTIRHSEDWDMISRMIMKGISITALPEVLVHVRAGNDFIRRRRNLSQFKGEINLFIRMYKIKYLNVFQLFGNIFIRVFLRALPAGITKAIYSRFLRS